MSRFNLPTRSRKVFTYEGGVGYKRPSDLELILGCLWPRWFGGGFYATSLDRMKRFIHLVDNLNNEFVAKLAIFSRQKGWNLVSPAVLLAELSIKTKGEGLVRKIAKRVLTRPDMINTAFAYIMARARLKNKTRINRYGVEVCSIPSQLKRAALDVFPMFDEYQLAKWAQYEREWNLGRVLKVSGWPLDSKDPKRRDIYWKLRNKLLKIPKDRNYAYILSEGSKDDILKFALEGPLFAVFKNLKRITQLFKKYGLKEEYKEVLERFTPESMYRARIYPFYIIYALRAWLKYLQNGYSDYLKLLRERFIWLINEVSYRVVKNASAFNKRMAVILDYSGSMDCFSKKGVATWLASSVAVPLKAPVIVFSNDAKTFHPLPNTDVLSFSETLLSRFYEEFDGGTYIQPALEEVSKLKEEIDLLIVFTDEQLHDAWFTPYNVKKVVIFVLDAYPVSMIKDLQILQVSGLSPFFLEFALKFTEGESLIREVEKVKI